MAAIKRETRELESQLAEAEAEYHSIAENLHLVQRQRLSAEEELMSQNVRLKQLQEELSAREGEGKEGGKGESRAAQLTMSELEVKVESAIREVLEQKLADEAFASTIMEQNDATIGGKVRVEFEGAEVYWALSDNYTFEMLQQDAARYWDLSTMDVVLYDESGAIWPSDAYVALEMQQQPTARIAMRVKPVAATIEEEVAMYGKEGEIESDEDDDDKEEDFMKIALAAEDELLIAQAKGATAKLTNKQRIALRRKLFREMLVFVVFITLFLYVLYTRRNVVDGYSMQQAIAAIFLDEAFGDFNEKTYLDIATAEEMFDWMGGPFLDGLYPAELYNGQEMPEDLQGYVMTYNKVIGKVRLRQLRVSPDTGTGCTTENLIIQTDTTRSGQERQRQFVDYCFPEYSIETASDEPFGPDDQRAPGTGFWYTSAAENGLDKILFNGEVASYDGSGYVIDLLGTNRTEFEVTLERLKSNFWVDRQTRCVLVTLNMYNGNYNYYCQAQFAIEYSAGGTVVPTSQLKIISLDIWEPEYWQGFQLSRSIPEMMLYGFLLAYLLQMLYRLFRTKRVTGSFRGHFRDPWNIFDLLLYGLMMVSVMLRLFYYLSDARTGFNPFDPNYQEMGDIAEAYTSVFTADAAAVLIIAFKTLKFFKLQRDLSMMRDTLAQAGKDLVVFMLLMLGLLLGFIVMGNNIFGTQAESFRSVFTTAGTMFLILLGEFDYDEMKQVNATFAFVFFVAYVLFMFFIVLNIFIAILNDAYAVVHTNDQWQEDLRKKKLTLREKFEVRRAMWRERKKMAYIKKLKKERIKDAKKKQREYEKRKKERMHMGTLGHQKRKERRKAEREAIERAADEGIELKSQHVSRFFKIRKSRPHE